MRALLAIPLLAALSLSAAAQEYEVFPPGHVFRALGFDLSPALVRMT